MAGYYDPKKVNQQPRFDANAAYNLSAFEVQRPSLYPEEEPLYRKPDLKVADERQKKSKSELRAEEVKGYKVSAKVVAVAVILFAMLAAVLYGESTKNQITHEINSINKQLNVAKSESTRLNMELNALVSIDQIEQYATEKLGMVKMNKYQIEYVNTAKPDQVKEDPGAGETAPAVQE